MITELLKQLIQTSPTSQQGEIHTAKTLENRLSTVGIETYIDCWNAKNANFFARISGIGKKPALLFAGHLDVVPQGLETWQFGPFDGLEKDGKICGRGSTDMLGGLAAVAEAMAEIKQAGTQLAGDIIFSATAGEETDSRGVMRFLETDGKNIGPLAGIIVPEPTGMTIMRAHRGILWLEITTAGKTAHGSMPQLGINAIEKMMAFLAAFKTYQIPHQPHPLLGGCSVSVNTIAGGQATNVVPDQCSVQIDIRTLPGQSHEAIIRDVQRIFEQLGRQDKNFKATLQVIRSVGALETPADAPFLKAVCKAVGTDEVKAVGFTTDGPWFAKLNAPVIIFGPGNPQMCHKPNEYIEVEQLHSAKEAFKRIILEMLG
jgi:succinyl-diaminopimelate desuccinylase